jgi:tetratricopeptide (TPR) repeat protein
VFDGMLRQGLSVQLGQSPFLSLVSDARIRQQLQLMDRPANTLLTPEIAQELCERNGSAAVVDGSIAALGSQYILGLRARNCTTGDVLFDEQARAATKEEVLDALSRTASRFRARVSESLASIKEHSTPLAEATTRSIDALKAFTTAMKVFFESGSAAAEPFFQRAVEIDPGFAMAHASLGTGYSDLGETVLSMESTTKAYQLRDRASDRERFFITPMYDRQVTGNFERLQQTLEAWARTYPRDPDAHGLLSGLATTSTGQYERSIEEARKAIALDPDKTFAYDSLAFSQLHLGRVSDSEATLQLASERRIEIPWLLVQRYLIAFLKGDREGMMRAAKQAKGKRVDDMMSHVDALVLARSGRLQEARRMSRVAVDVAQQAGERERAAMFDAAPAIWEAFFGNAEEARRRAAGVLAQSTGRDVQYAAAFALARSGDPSRARMLADDLERRFPEDTSVKFNYLPTLRALISVNAGKPDTAVEQLQVSTRYDFAVPGLAFNGLFGAMYSVYVRGEAYLAGHQPAAAAKEFQNVLDHRGIVLADPVDALARLQLARALAQAGDTGKVKATYQNLLTLWNAADPDTSLVKQARAEYARLQ